ncbi:fatty acid synthase-like [Aricia agestis]|uniref:fatty acid synthase-like n=1 Tax=Aricia agestis TaxID=91739 RepID=UPI001C2082C1|nr:fatty acid synthase-like [Aricia agestis]
MAPIPEEYAQNDSEETDVGEHVVISGMAGLYPSSHDVNDLSNILYNKINPIKKSDRWTSAYSEASQHIGVIPDLEYFDAQFFRVTYRLSSCMDPMSRKLLEQTYQAIFDAGCSPEHLSGKNIGVFVGTCFSETEKAFLYVLNAKSGLGIAGCNRSMFANRISYYLNIKGPSMTIDMSCCSSSGALQMAYDSIVRGECEGAIVGGCNLCLHPQTSIHYGRVIDLCRDGKTKSFDAHADGCCKSEAINIVFLQKAKDALRIYARIVHAKSGFIPLPESDIGAEWGFNRNPSDVTGFLETFYKEANVEPREVQFVEAFGAGGRESDKTELMSIDEFFCKNRSKPLMVGSVMSNVGYTESASGLTSVTKVLLGYQQGKMAANLHYNAPRDDIAAIKERRIEILTDHKEFIPTYTAINNISLSGVFSHILLHGYNKKKDVTRYKALFPRLVLSSGRDETSIKKIFDNLKSKPIDPEEHALLHHFYQKKIVGHLGRGFLILDTNENNETVKLHEESTYFDQGKRPLWFVYSGMGSQWVGMGKDLMRIPVFAAAIERCDRVLAPRGINIVDIITSDDKKMFDNILHSFVGINAIQIALTDVLRSIGIVPDMIIGHSMGEYCCAYADGCFSTEETILCAYSRGLFSLQTPFIRGSMAAVGLGFKEISKIIPPEIVVACHNSAESCTISGPAEIMEKFVFSLTSQGIFAKEVACSNIAYHSRYVADAGPALLKYMQELIPTPRLRSSRWLSTSVPQDRWDEPLAKYSSAEYHLNNFLSPVLFEETSHLIPPDAVLIEIAPHGLLQAILKRSLPSTCKQISLTRRGHPDNSRYLLEAIGRLYIEGYDPKIEALYPRVEFPVSTSTPMLSHLVDWVYQEEWSLDKPKAANKRIAATSQDVISTYDEEHNYLKGHIIKGKNLYPFSAALVAVWDTLAASLNVKKNNLSVQFENVYFHSQPILNVKHQLSPYVAIQKGTGRFEVLNENSLMITGTVIPEIRSDRLLPNTSTISDTNVCTDDIYDILYGKEYQYLNDFRSIHSSNESLTEALLEWKDNWVTFLDGIIQLNVLSRKHHTVSKLNLIRRIVIDVDKQRNSIVGSDDREVVNAKVLELHDATICGGVVMEGLKFVDLPLSKHYNVELKICKFIPLFSPRKINETKSLYMFLQIVADNVKKEKINIVEIINSNTNLKYSNVQQIIDKIPSVKANYLRLSLDEKCEDRIKNADLILTTNLFNDEKMWQQLNNSLRQDEFIIHKHNLGDIDTPFYTVVSGHNIEDGRMELAVWRATKPDLSKTLVLRSPKYCSSQDVPGGEYFVPLEDENDAEKSVTLKIKRIGDIDSLCWTNEDLHNEEMGVEVQVHYAGVNIVYVNKLIGTQFHGEGDSMKSVIDFSGLANSGSRVMGLLHGDVLSSKINVNPELLLPVPEYWSLEDAATVPLAYSMAFYILAIKARVNSKHVLCVQGAAGALGQAIISVALAFGCEVFATVSSYSKKQFLKKVYPQLKDDHIIDHSRDLNFVYDILRATNGKGCNVLISCATDELKNMSWSFWDADRHSSDSSPRKLHLWDEQFDIAKNVLHYRFFNYISNRLF